jgi:hypothetical protein
LTHNGKDAGGYHGRGAAHAEGFMDLLSPPGQIYGIFIQCNDGYMDDFDLYSVETGFGVHPASYPMGTGD